MESSAVTVVGVNSANINASATDDNNTVVEALLCSSDPPSSKAGVTAGADFDSDWQHQKALHDTNRLPSHSVNTLVHVVEENWKNPNAGLNTVVEGPILTGTAVERGGVVAADVAIGTSQKASEGENEPEKEAEKDMSGLAYLPLEVLHEIFCEVELKDIINLSTTCRHLRQTIDKDDLLWRAQYCKIYDEPTYNVLSWGTELRKLKGVQTHLQQADNLAKEEKLEEIGNLVLSLLTETVDPINKKNQQYLCKLMATRSNKSCFMSRSSLFRRAGLFYDQPADTEELRQLSAKVHVYYGLEIELEDHELQLPGSQEVHTCARSRVYDLRRYKQENFWGPFMDDGSGRVDWEKVQAIMIVLAHGLRIFSQRIHGIVGLFWDEPFQGCHANSFQGVSLSRGDDEGPSRPEGRPSDPSDDASAVAQQEDPYGVSGTWMRVVNFLDFHDLFAYNFQNPITSPDEERAPISTKEAIRLILLRLKVVKIEERGLEEEGDDPNFPRVYFEGTSKSLTNNWDSNANSSIRGYVRTTPHGDVRWTTFSVFGDEERWRSESVQVGGRKSARGTLGNWFDKDYDRHGPAGPTAFWKISDDVLSSSSSTNRNRAAGNAATSTTTTTTNANGNNGILAAQAAILTTGDEEDSEEDDEDYEDEEEGEGRTEEEEDEDTSDDSPISGGILTFGGGGPSSSLPASRPIFVILQGSTTTTSSGSGSGGGGDGGAGGASQSSASLSPPAPPPPLLPAHLVSGGGSGGNGDGNGVDEHEHEQDEN